MDVWKIRSVYIIFQVGTFIDGNIFLDFFSSCIYVGERKVEERTLYPNER